MTRLVTAHDNYGNSTRTYTYDSLGNLILEQYGKNKKLETAGEYTYNETNKMGRGVNGNAEESIYTYNGLGALMENTWIIAKNGYGYHDVSGEEDTTTPTDPTPDVPDPGETTDPDTPDPGKTHQLHIWDFVKYGAMGG